MASKQLQIAPIMKKTILGGVTVGIASSVFIISLYALIETKNPNYLTDVSRIQNPDASQYILLGKNIVSGNGYSRSSHKPFAPDMLRGPVYPVLCGVLLEIGGMRAIHIFNCIMGIGTSVLLYLIGAKLFSHKVGLFSGILLGCDSMYAVSHFTAMSETSYLFIFLAGIYFIGKSNIFTDCEAISYLKYALGVAIIGCSALSRPSSLYEPVLLVALFVGPLMRNNQAFERRKIILYSVLPFILVVGPWITRNYLVFGIPKLTNVDTSNFVYFVGAGAYQREFNLSLDEAKEQIEQEYNIPAYSEVQNPWISDKTPKEIEASLKAVKNRVVFKYPFRLLESTALGISKALISHNTKTLCYLINQDWNAPGASKLLTLNKEAYTQIFNNSTLPIAVFLYQIVYAPACLLLSLVGGCYMFAVCRNRLLVWFILIQMAYFYATVAMFGLEAYWRCRIPLLPWIYLVDAYFIVEISRKSRISKRLSEPK